MEIGKIEHSIMRRLLRPLWMLLALVFLVEAWLWDRLAPLVRAVLDAVASWSIRQRLAAFVDRLSPPGALVVFAVPALIYLGFELLALWPLAYGRWITALAVLIVAKIIGAAMTAFAFDVTRDKLLQMGWFRVAYETLMRWLATAHRLADPYLTRIRAAMQRLRTRLGPMIRRWRRQAAP